jgi:hypothetical protein
MNCRKVYRNLSAYHDKLLSPKNARKLEQHLRECPECMQRWREFSEIVKASGYLQVHKPSPDFNQRLLRRVATVGPAAQVDYEPSGGKRWPGYALALAGVAAAVVVFLTFPYLRSAKVDTFAEAPEETALLDEILDPAGGTVSYQVLQSDDSLWQLFDLAGIDEFEYPDLEMVGREARVYRSYVLPVVDVERESSFAGESYLLTPVSSGGIQSANVVF